MSNCILTHGKKLKTLYVEKDSSFGIASIFLNRSKQRNGFTQEMAYELEYIFKIADLDNSVKGIIIYVYIIYMYILCVFVGKGTFYCPLQII